MTHSVLYYSVYSACIGDVTFHCIHFEQEHEGDWYFPGAVLHSGADFMGGGESDLEVGIESAVWGYQSTFGIYRYHGPKLAD